MSDIAVRIEGLSKQYRIRRGPAGRTLYDAITAAFAAPFRRLPGHRQSAIGDRQTACIWALKDVTFDLRRGEVLGIIGRNGAGKSTLLKILSRITEPTEGTADLYGRVNSLLEVGTGFHPELTGRENIFLNGAILGMRRWEIGKKFDEIVAFAEVGPFLDTAVKHYSSGMYLRLAFAVAAHLEPDILLVDEVLAVGDAAFQRKCLGKMGDVVKAGRTILFVSHNMGAVRSLCPDCLLLHEGRVSRLGPAVEVVDTYLNASLGPTGVALDLHGANRRSGMGERLRLLQVELNTGKGIRHGEPFSARIEYEATADVRGVAVGVGFSTLDGTRLMTLDSDLDGNRRDLPRGARGRVSTRLPLLYLQPGHYTLDVGARSGDNVALDYLPGCAHVEVFPGGNTPGMLIREGGGVRHPAEWLWEDCPRVGA